ncbi:MAG: hypothetical protein KatS3mg111_1324 [Pirellulaceae bacterium]|nr:MAG: hypothetical protein KatS3mg111_1324 [Pirellulaceae bacterium]
MTVVLLSRDLLFTSRIQAAFRAAGCEVVAVPRADDVRLNSVEDSHLVGCLVDLSNVPAPEVAGTLQSLAKRFPQTQIFAFGPHVQREKLQAAQQAQATAVMTRGQFDRSLPTIVAHWTQAE